MCLCNRGIVDLFMYMLVYVYCCLRCRLFGSSSICVVVRLLVCLFVCSFDCSLVCLLVCLLVCGVYCLGVQVCSCLVIRVRVCSLIAWFVWLVG